MSSSLSPPHPNPLAHSLPPEAAPPTDEQPLLSPALNPRDHQTSSARNSYSTSSGSDIYGLDEDVDGLEEEDEGDESKGMLRSGLGFDDGRNNRAIWLDGNVDEMEDTEATEEVEEAGGWRERAKRIRGGPKRLFANRYIVLCAAFSTLGGLLFGYDQGVVSVILVMPQFLGEFPSVDDAAPGAGFFKGLLTAMIEAGALVGALNQGWIADKYSRRYSILIAVVIFTIGSTMQTAASSYPVLAVARLIGGGGIGMLSMVVPLYISEISPPELRGGLLVLQELSIVVGVVLAFWITFVTRKIPSNWSWRLPFLIQMIPGIILGIGVFFLPFTPRWLATKNRDHEARTTLARLRQLPESNAHVKKELFDIQVEVAFQKEMSITRHPKLQDGSISSNIKLEFASWTDCFKTGCWRRTHVGMGLMFFQQFCGINALIYYAPTLFATMGLNAELCLVMAGLLDSAQLVSVTISIPMMDHFGRRPLLLWGGAFMTASLIAISIVVGLFSHDWLRYTAEGWVSVAFLFVYMVFFGATWGPVPWAMPSEIFPSSLRAKGVALSTASNWWNNFVIGLITPPLVQNTGFGVWVFFAVFCFLSFIWTYMFVPETNGRSLEQMDALFKDASGERDQAKRSSIAREIALRDM